jgi:DNA-binding HxlR family transcriptional regulator
MGKDTFDYGEACPISRATSVLCERWTLQLIREMFMGASRFSEFQTYLPKISPSLLNTRLRTLEAEGLVIRKRIPEKRGYEYLLTPAGLSLQPVLSELGKWGMHWAFDSMDDEDLNVSTIVRDFAFALDPTQLPAGETTIQFTVSTVEETTSKFILVRDGHVQVCHENLGHEVDVYVSATLKELYEVWFGEMSVAAARDCGKLKVTGIPAYTKSLGKWLRTSQFASENPRRVC